MTDERDALDGSAVPAVAAVPVDLEPAARELAALVRGVREEALEDPTPCEKYTVRDLLRHIAELAVGLRVAALKDLGPGTERTPGTAMEELPPDWREAVPHRLAELAAAWSDPAAWEGTTQAGGVTLSGTECGLVTLDELVVHGWDLARATGQAFHSDETRLRAVHGLLAGAAEGGEEGGADGGADGGPDGG
ncbi:TIGR03086 family metal-binding protein, partial [Streptomyces boncukensis]